MNAVTVDLANLLQTHGDGTRAATTGWGIYIGVMPTEPHTCITLYDGGGGHPDYAMCKTVAHLDREFITVRVRGFNYEQAWTKLRHIADYLCGLERFTVAGSDYQGMFQESIIQFLGMDDNNRYMFTVDIGVVRKAA